MVNNCEKKYIKIKKRIGYLKNEYLAEHYYKILNNIWTDVYDLNSRKKQLEDFETFFNEYMHLYKDKKLNRLLNKNNKHFDLLNQIEKQVAKNKLQVGGSNTDFNTILEEKYEDIFINSFLKDYATCFVNSIRISDEFSVFSKIELDYNFLTFLILNFQDGNFINQNILKWDLEHKISKCYTKYRARVRDLSASGTWSPDIHIKNAIAKTNLDTYPTLHLDPDQTIENIHGTAENIHIIENQTLQNYSYKDLEYVTFRNCKFEGFILGCNMKQVRFENCVFGHSLSLDKLQKQDPDTGNTIYRDFVYPEPDPDNPGDMIDGISGFIIEEKTSNTGTSSMNITEFYLANFFNQYINRRSWIYEVEFAENNIESCTFDTCAFYLTKFSELHNAHDIYFDNCAHYYTKYCGHIFINNSETENTIEQYLPVSLHFKGTYSKGTIFQAVTISNSVLENSVFVGSISLPPQLLAGTESILDAEYSGCNFDNTPLFDYHSIELLRNVEVKDVVFILNHLHTISGIKNVRNFDIIKNINTELNNKQGNLILKIIPYAVETTLTSFSESRRIITANRTNLDITPSVLIRNINLENILIINEIISDANYNDPKFFQYKIDNLSCNNILIKDHTLVALSILNSDINNCDINGNDFLYFRLENNVIESFNNTGSEFNEISLINTTNIIIDQAELYSANLINLNGGYITLNGNLERLTASESDINNIIINATEDGEFIDKIILLKTTINNLEVYGRIVQNCDFSYSLIKSFKSSKLIDTILLSNSSLENGDLNQVALLDVLGKYTDYEYSINILNSINGIILERAINAIITKVNFSSNSNNNQNITSASFENCSFISCTFDEISIINQKIRGFNINSCQITKIKLHSTVISNSEWVDNYKFILDVDGFTRLDQCKLLIDLSELQNTGKLLCGTCEVPKFNIDYVNSENILFTRCKNMNLNIKDGNKLSQIKFDMCQGKKIIISNISDNNSEQYISSSRFRIYEQRKNKYHNFICINSSINIIKCVGIVLDLFRIHDSDSDSLKIIGGNTGNLKFNKYNSKKSALLNTRSKNIIIIDSRLREHISSGLKIFDSFQIENSFLKYSKWSKENLDKLKQINSII